MLEGLWARRLQTGQPLAVVDSESSGVRLAGMKSLLRLCLFLLFSVTLPVNAMAHLLMSVEPCAMHGSQMPSIAVADDAHSHGMSDQMASRDACCDAKTQMEHKQPCKPGLDCKAGSLLQVGSSKSSLPLIGQPGPFPLSFTPLPGTSEPLWHPPRS